MLGTVAFLLLSAHSDVIGVVTSGGKPLAGATVALYTARPKQGVPVYCPSCYLDCGKRSITDAKGRFRLPAVDPTLIFRALVIKDGYQPQFVRGVDSAKGAFRVAMEPRKKAKQESSIVGRIVDEKGNPVEGATLEPYGWKTPTVYSFGDMAFMEPLGVSNAKGGFTFHSTRKDGALLLRIEARGFAPRMVPGLVAGKQNSIVLREGATVQGTVRDANGKGVGGVIVQVVPQEQEASVFTGVMTIGTDAEGRFLLPNVPANRSFHVYATMASLGSHRLGVPTQIIATGADGSTSQDVDLVATPSTTVKGRVVTTDGKPIPAGTRILLVRNMTFDMQEAILGRDGSFTFESIPFDNPIQITVGMAGYSLGRTKELQRNRWGHITLTVPRNAPPMSLTLPLNPDKP